MSGMAMTASVPELSGNYAAPIKNARVAGLTSKFYKAEN
jgi:hypothetical protein